MHNNRLESCFKFLKPFDPEEWLTSNLSSHYHPLITKYGHKNKEIITNWGISWLLDKLSSSTPSEMCREQYGEYTCSYSGVGGKGNWMGIVSQGLASNSH